MKIGTVASHIESAVMNNYSYVDTDSMVILTKVYNKLVIKNFDKVNQAIIVNLCSQKCPEHRTGFSQWYRCEN